MFSRGRSGSITGRAFAFHEIDPGSIPDHPIWSPSFFIFYQKLYLSEEPGETLSKARWGPTNIKTNTQNKNVLHFINKLSNISVIHPVYHQLASPSCPFLFNIQNAFRESLKSVLPSSSREPNKYLCSLTCIIIFPKKSHAQKKEALLLKVR